ncbi:bifunctional 5,10-methylenetetrahydrofolate dehydrogenase/5,10-methenyltetrahydrofolate cyclohydrolase [bacterium]|nr:bifunctional 5,10-methylenetetrahydrofolate dehydrogenase/5,10-methenyltetrahydrofolate cyclohydrolase [bacterium]
MKILDGRASSAAAREAVSRAALFLRKRGIHPRLAAILVGRNPASESYVAGKRRAAKSCGIDSLLFRLPASTSQSGLHALIGRLNRRRDVHGILLQLPLPARLSAEEALVRISPEKDVDGLHPENLGRLAAGVPRFVPCTPKGVLHLLDFFRVPVEGKHVVIVGRSRLVGRPLALLFIHRNATVTVCHSRTRRLAQQTRRADILVAAAGRKHLIRASHVQKGAVVVDVGIHVSVSPSGAKRFHGDVSPSVRRAAGVLSPVPGGVGPETVAQLLANTVRAAARCLAAKHAGSFERSHLHRL